MIIAVIPVIVFASKINSIYIKRSMVNIQNYYIRNLFTIPMNKIRNIGSEKILSDELTRMQKVESNYFGLMCTYASGFFQVILGAILALYTDFLLLPLTVVLIIAMLIGVSIVSSRIDKLTSKYNKSYEKYTRFIREVIDGHAIICENSMEEDVNKEAEPYIHNLEDDTQRLGKESLKISMVLQIILFIVLILYIAIRVIRTIDGNVTVGESIFVTIILAYVVSPAFSMISISQQREIGLKSLKEIETQIEESNNLKTEMNSEPSSLKLENVTFKYGEKVVLKDISVEFLYGLKYLIIGESGSGKSTILNILVNYLIPEDGDVYVDNQMINNVKEKYIYERIAFLEQDVFLFNDTLYNNICLGKQYDENEIMDLISHTGLEYLVSSHKEGLNYIIEGNGTNISGGEAVRIGLCRELIRKPKYLLLDEPFSHLDADNINKIESWLLGIKDITIINVSHIIDKKMLSLYDVVFKTSDEIIEEINPRFIEDSVKM